MCVYLNLIPKFSILSNTEKVKTVLNHLDQRILLAAAFAFGCLALGYFVLRSHVIVLSLKSMILDYLDPSKKQLFFSKTSNGKVNFHDLLKSNSSKIPGRNITSLLSNSDNLSQLTDLNLRNNQLTSLPSEIGNCSQLTDLYLSVNQLKNLPWDISNSSQLIYLDLQNKQLTSVPSEIGNCSQLIDLYLSHNQLTNLPSEIGNLSQLTDLYLHNNRLTSLPSEIGNCSQLTGLYLSNNRLTSVPSEIGNCSQLTTLYLHNNRLTSLPSEIGNCSRLTCLRLRNNQLTSLPSQLGLLVFLKILDVRSNPNLTELPLSLGQCPELTDIQYYGTSIPESQVRAILGMSQALRNKQVSDLLPKRLAAWKVFSKDNFELGFIDKLSEQEKEAISEWLLRLERTKDFSGASQRSLACSVCGILQSLNESPSFKSLFFDQLSVNLTGCGDRAAMAFNELFLSWKLETLDVNMSEHDTFKLMLRASKTAALRKAIQNAIEKQEAKEGQLIHESVEIYLYYETQLKKQLDLLSFMNE
ncbi:MAG: leucine-rich repeat domain-containing protein, partial [Parachlamydiaceae bacterium]